MKVFALIILTSFYLSGVLFLPMGDFSTIPDLPKIFKHCKETEDRDLNVFEFFTEHLTDIGEIIGKNDQEAGDKPHAPVQFHFHLQIVECNISKTELPQIKHNNSAREILPQLNKIYLSDYIGKIFRPPIL